jgi:hypothetical protein
LGLNPIHAYVENIGNDGSGIHCGESPQYAVDVSLAPAVIQFPDNIFVSDILARRYQAFFSGYNSDSFADSETQLLHIEHLEQQLANYTNSRAVRGALQLQNIIKRQAWRELFGWSWRAARFVMRKLFRRRAPPLVRSEQHINKIKQFMENGAKPWTTGYHEYKWERIAEYIHADFSVLIGTEKYGYRIDERAVELPWLLSCLDDRPGVMLDAGSALNFPAILQHPKICTKKLFISTLAYEGIACPELGNSYVYEDLRQTCFKEDFFDIIACISTIEHIGMDNTFLYTRDTTKKEQNREDYLSFLDIMRSRLKPGGRLYVSFPFGKTCSRGWFQVFDAVMADRLIARFQPASYKETIFYYSNNRWHLSSREEAAEATCFDIHVQKKYEPDYLAFSRSVACLELVK